MSAKAHRAAASCHDKSDAAGEHKHCAESVKHSEAAHKASVATQSGGGMKKEQASRQSLSGRRTTIRQTGS